MEKKYKEMYDDKIQGMEKKVIFFMLLLYIKC